MVKGSSHHKPTWTLLSNHGHVLVCLGRDPDARLREVAAQVGITERAVFKIIAELEDAGVIRRIRTGRRNHYEINLSATLRHPLEADRTVGGLLSTLLERAQMQQLNCAKR